MPATNLQIAAYLRVAAYAIALFDFMQTIPVEYRLYAKQKGIFNMTIACNLFILVRILGVTALLIGAFGFFHHGFTTAQCNQFFWLFPIFKLFLYIVSQVILSLRTYAVSRKSSVVLYILLGLFLISGAAEFAATFWKRVREYLLSIILQFNLLIPFVSCTSGNLPGVKVASLFYAGTLLFDIGALSLTAVYLWKFSNSSRAPLSRLAKMMIEDGIMYFVALTSMNIVNLIFFQDQDPVLQSAASSLGFAVTMIYSGRFILTLSERSRDGLSGDDSHSSRTPTSGGRRHANRTLGLDTRSEGPDNVVITVMKNVVTVSDMEMGQVDSASSPKEVKWAERDL
ncbi:hypothetical protein R3P38DRAFT_2539156 [Favolaschia claudopus]|uniref:Uncharacterized protein n=1 Tax=Favolaschia claudopus TaxID=2862362 RepID=A0AAW0AZH9_9AGAR